jgi:hypothetical protein
MPAEIFTKRFFTTNEKGGIEISADLGYDEPVRSGGV